MPTKDRLGAFWYFDERGRANGADRTRFILSATTVKSNQVRKEGQSRNEISARKEKS